MKTSFLLCLLFAVEASAKLRESPSVAHVNALLNGEVAQTPVASLQTDDGDSGEDAVWSAALVGKLMKTARQQDADVIKNAVKAKEAKEAEEQKKKVEMTTAAPVGNKYMKLLGLE
mmetsp:Transcript_127724/g.255109  ORF Transcript_127724/g.255109 Transcript_127724/m.255109 type:complete len:116 (-) Transcript_127724:63-410(-)|eukprot:CAMPEP_0172694400 /NCGR_PEP_ID=MMETSP1074-20121228/26648_1 /TAXON_ID=2916 /ORGANISM="Ceratium fusus, Strain PA161109" /LENGTH=115 /DNA_ID=CAMNT_0013514899 /DNA_START=63 /DNA_END=410 /DNA_ORIENTATION=-